MGSSSSNVSSQSQSNASSAAPNFISRLWLNWRTNTANTTNGLILNDSNIVLPENVYLPADLHDLSHRTNQNTFHDDSTSLDSEPSSKGECSISSLLDECETDVSDDVNDISDAVILDIGSDTCKIGLANESQPRHIFPSIIGRPKNQIKIDKDYMVGNEAKLFRMILNISSPIEDGVIKNWFDFYCLLRYALEALTIDSISERPFIIIDSNFSGKEQRERLAKIFFEDFNILALYFANKSVMSLLATGRSTGLVLDSGDGITSVVPVYGGHAITHATMKLDISGRVITNYLGVLLSSKGFKFRTFSEKESLKNIKESMTYVAHDIQEERLKESKQRYTMPDGQFISLENERIECGELFFEPTILQSNSLGIHKMIYESIQLCDKKLHRHLCSNIILSGGSTKYEGLAGRLAKELNILAASAHTPTETVRFEIHEPQERENLSWIGATKLAKTKSLLDLYVTYDEYKKYGTSTLHRKCF